MAKKSFSLKQLIPEENIKTGTKFIVRLPIAVNYPNIDLKNNELLVQNIQIAENRISNIEEKLNNIINNIINNSNLYENVYANLYATN